jgi:hypothetical protein
MPRCNRIASSTARMSAAESTPFRLRRRCLSAVMIWSAMALAGSSPMRTSASPGYTLEVLLVSGTTTTRFSARFAALLLITTAGRVFRISLPTVGPKDTHHTSPLFTGCISNQPFAPLQCFRLSRLVSCHFLILGQETACLLKGEFLDAVQNRSSEFVRYDEPCGNTPGLRVAYSWALFPIPTDSQHLVVFPLQPRNRPSSRPGVIEYVN